MRRRIVAASTSRCRCDNTFSMSPLYFFLGVCATHVIRLELATVENLRPHRSQYTTRLTPLMFIRCSMSHIMTDLEGFVKSCDKVTA